MEKVDKLAGLLKRLNEGEDPEKVKIEAKDFLASVDSSELAFAEQKLVESGLKPEDLRHLCVAHMEMLGDTVEKMKSDLKPGHVVHTLVLEHDKILDFLQKLDEVNGRIQGLEKFDSKNGDFGLLQHIAEHLVGAEPHHKREEDVLFPELEQRGVYGPPGIMRMEHEELRARKKKLLELSKNAGKLDFNEFKKELDIVSKFIVFTLRDHIFKENNILYPMALDVILESGVWDKMKVKCDKIGYCCFTPSK